MNAGRITRLLMKLLMWPYKSVDKDNRRKTIYRGEEDDWQITENR